MIINWKDEVGESTIENKQNSNGYSWRQVSNAALSNRREGTNTRRLEKGRRPAYKHSTRRVFRPSVITRLGRR